MRVFSRNQGTADLLSLSYKSKYATKFERKRALQNARNFVHPVRSKILASFDEELMPNPGKKATL